MTILRLLIYFSNPRSASENCWKIQRVYGILMNQILKTISCLEALYRKPLKGHIWWITTIGLHGQTMVDHGFQKSVYETLGLGSSPKHGNFIFYFFDIFCPAEAQNHPSVKISAKKLSVIFLSHFLPDNLW
jgi:hypothetical protein